MATTHRERHYLGLMFEDFIENLLPLFGLKDIQRHAKAPAPMHPRKLRQGYVSIDFLAKQGNKRIGIECKERKVKKFFKTDIENLTWQLQTYKECFKLDEIWVFTNAELEISLPFVVIIKVDVPFEELLKLARRWLGGYV